MGNGQEAIEEEKFDEEGHNSNDALDSKEISLFIELYESLSNKIDKEIGRLHDAYKWYAGTVIVIFIFTLACAFHLFWGKSNSVHEVIGKEIDQVKEDVILEKRGIELSKQEIEREIEYLRSGVISGIQSMEKQLDLANRSINLSIEDAKLKVNERVDNQFTSENIQKLLESNVRSRIDSIASPIIEEKLVVTKSSILQLERLAEFIKTDIAARSDDRIAFEQIRTWAEDENYPLKNEAILSYNSIMNEHRRLSYESQLIARLNPDDNFQPTMKYMVDLYNKEAIYFRPLIIQAFWGDKRIPERVKIQFLIFIVDNEKSLNAVETASGLLIHKYKLDLAPLAIRSVLEAMRERNLY